jgi:hypothetical protein
LKLLLATKLQAEALTLAEKLIKQKEWVEIGRLGFTYGLELPCGVFLLTISLMHTPAPEGHESDTVLYPCTKNHHWTP